MRRTGLLSALVTLVAAGAVAGETGWLTDFDQAKKLAAEKSRPILVEFSGSDWCGWCIRLGREVLDTEAFRSFAGQKLVLLSADFPREKKLPAATEAQNKRLAEAYGVEGFPTLLLLDAEGKLLARTGYRRGGPEAYVEHLRGLLAEAGYR